MGRQAHGAEEAEAAYDQIADVWARTRSGPWPEVTQFLASLPRGALVADVGGGSGRYLRVKEAEGLRMLTLDRSRKQLAVAKRDVPGSRLVRADARAVPVRTGSADAALLVAVIHHLERAEERGEVLRELVRLLRPGATALITVWGTHDEDFRDAARAPGGGPNDYLVPFKAEQKVPVERFFHAFSEGELAAEVERAGFRAVRVWAQRGNWVAEATA